jgi:uncharacterized membrane protein YfcA
MFATVFVVATLAFGLSALSGGGAGLMLIPVLSMVLPTAQVPAALSLGTTISSCSRIAMFRERIQWRIVRWFVPAALPAAWLGVWLLSYVDPRWLEMALGAFLLANLPQLLRPAGDDISGRALPIHALALIGMAAGFISGLTGAVGLIFNRFYLRYGLTKEQVIATRAANEIILHVVKLAMYAWFGLFTDPVVRTGLLIGAAALLAAWLTRRWLPYLREATFRRLGYGAMVASGLFMSSHAVSGLVDEHDLVVAADPQRRSVHGKLTWRETRFSLELGYDDGIAVRKVVELDELPDDRRESAVMLALEADIALIEEVHTIGRHYYQAHVYRDGLLVRHEF